MKEVLGTESNHKGESEPDVPQQRDTNVLDLEGKSETALSTVSPTCTQVSNETNIESEGLDEGGASVSLSFTGICCASLDKAFQLTNKHTLSQLASNGRNFNLNGINSFCGLRHAQPTRRCTASTVAMQSNQHTPMVFTKTGYKAFTHNGF